MKQLIEILEGIEDNHETLVRFSNGNSFVLIDFEMVDEDIYQRSDLCVGDITAKVKVDRDVYKVGNKLEFSVDEIFEIKDTMNGSILYRKNK